VPLLVVDVLLGLGRADAGHVDGELELHVCVLLNPLQEGARVAFSVVPRERRFLVVSWVEVHDRQAHREVHGVGEHVPVHVVAVRAHALHAQLLETLRHYVELKGDVAGVLSDRVC